MTRRALSFVFLLVACSFGRALRAQDPTPATLYPPAPTQKPPPPAATKPGAAGLDALGAKLKAAGQDGAVPNAQAPVAPTQSPMPSVLSIEVVGADRYTADQLRIALGVVVGAPYSTEQASRGLDNLHKSLHVRAKLQLRSKEAGIELRLLVEEMNADLEPRFVGNAEVDLEELLKWAQIEEKSELYLYQAERVRQRLLDGYRREGFAFAEVDVVRRGEVSGARKAGEIPDVIFEIREGPCVRVKDIQIRGNQAMPERGFWLWKDGLPTLAKIELGGPKLLNWFGEKFVEETLRGDLQAMREVYRDRGFLDAVVELDHLERSSDRTGVVIHIIVDEGQPYRVSKFAFEGIVVTPGKTSEETREDPTPLLFPEAELRAKCKISEGAIYSRSDQALDALAMTEYYGQRGYLSSRTLGPTAFQFLDPRLVFDPAKHEVEVVYRLVQGQKRWVHEVSFSGAEHTRDRVLRREVDVLEGDLADITKIRKSLQRIYSTSFFNDEFAPFEHHDPTYVIKPTPDPRFVDLEFQVEEGRVINFQVQGGVDSNNGLFARLTISMRNFDITDTPSSLWAMFSEVYDKHAFHGAGQRVDLELSPGTVVDTYRARFLEPDIFRTHFRRYSFDVEANRYERSERFYDESRQEQRIRLGHELTRDLAIFTGYTHTLLGVTDLDAPLEGLSDPDALPLPPSIYQEVGESDLSGVLFDIQYRDVDNLFNPQNGALVTVRNKLYGGELGGDYQFARFDLDADFFWPLSGSSPEVGPTWHFGFGLGLADAFGETSETPYTERFFLGGNKNLRGFEYRGVGPNLGDNTLGGETSFDATIEARFPIWKVTQPGTYKQVETMRIVLFADMGILGVDPYSLPLDEMRSSVGIGFGLLTPFPVTLSFGFPLQEAAGDRTQLFSFSLFNLAF